ncbi:MAG TPA: aldo/keto reductase [Candidatus Scybalocola faecipullorum]|nr:aldo/keto reductase [Candidatus Scybalocola faecipullorum]
MIYKNFQDLKLSALGMGAMRLPVVGDDDGVIDEAAATAMVATAMKQGINYYDTAWGYHNGQSEIVLGKALKAYPRENFYLADKFPGYDLANMDKVEEIFEAQLKKCGVTYFDFYLFHNVCEMNIDAYLNPDYGIFDYLKKQRDEGRIRHLGFSAHGNYDVMKRFLEAYGDDMEFCQIQLNYLDWSFQDAKAKVELLTEYHIPVWVMEPLRGGRLCRLTDEEEKILKSMRPDETVPAWAFRFLQSIPEVTVVLSGMSDMQQLEENIETFKENRPLSSEEMGSLMQMAENMVKKIALPCTACHYCVSHCPQGLDIPSLLALYNEHCFTEGGFIAPMALSAIPEDKQPNACIGCRSCEAVCPQQIKISEAMADFCSKLGMQQ